MTDYVSPDVDPLTLTNDAAELALAEALADFAQAARMDRQDRAGYETARTSEGKLIRLPLARNMS